VYGCAIVEKISTGIACSCGPSWLAELAVRGLTFDSFRQYLKSHFLATEVRSDYLIYWRYTNKHLSISHLKCGNARVATSMHGWNTVWSLWQNVLLFMTAGEDAGPGQFLLNGHNDIVSTLGPQCVWYIDLLFISSSSSLGRTATMWARIWRRGAHWVWGTEDLQWVSWWEVRWAKLPLPERSQHITHIWLPNHAHFCVFS